VQYCCGIHCEYQSAGAEPVGFRPPPPPDESVAKAEAGGPTLLGQGPIVYDSTAAAPPAPMAAPANTPVAAPPAPADPGRATSPSTRPTR
jgi:hypothetical protein